MHLLGLRGRWRGGPSSGGVRSSALDCLPLKKHGLRLVRRLKSDEEAVLDPLARARPREETSARPPKHTQNNTRHRHVLVGWGGGGGGGRGGGGGVKTRGGESIAVDENFAGCGGSGRSSAASEVFQWTSEKAFEDRTVRITQNDQVPVKKTKTKTGGDVNKTNLVI